MLPSPPSQTEAKLYYTGLHSAPVLVARTGTTLWEEPTSPESHWHQKLKLKELRPIGNHAINVTGVDPITLDTGTELVAAALKPRRGVLNDAGDC